MANPNSKRYLIPSFAIVISVVILGFFLKSSITSFKEYERTVTVKGLAEQEYPANIVIWPIRYTEASNNLEEVYTALDNSSQTIEDFLVEKGIPKDEIFFSPPLLTDKSAQQYGGGDRPEFRYVANQNVTVFSENVDQVREVMDQLVDLGKQGITLSGNEYQVQTEYLFTELNDIKPEMIEQATKEARRVAKKFAEDSNSELGKIKKASQGQFSISPRDKNTPYIKKIRVVSTIEYYLSD